MPVPRTEPLRRQPPGVRRAALLEVLRDRGTAMAVAELAPLAGLHPNTVRAHLDVLVRTGQVQRRTDARHTPGRPRELFEATGTEVGDRSYQLLAEVLADRLAELTDDPADAAAEAGRRWALRREPAATTSEPLAPVVQMLRVHGFAPEVSADGAAIELHHCPFLELARERPDIVCGAHLGLIRGALERTGAEVVATRIVPFARPHVCVTELAAAPR